MRRTFTAVIARDSETGFYVGFVPGFPGAHTQGETLDELNANLKERGISISIKDDGVGWLLQKTLPDRSYGARPLRRAIQRHIEDALSEAFIRGQIRPHRPIEIGVQDAVLWYWQEGRGGALSGVGVPA